MLGAWGEVQGDCVQEKKGLFCTNAFAGVSNVIWYRKNALLRIFIFSFNLKIGQEMAIILPVLKGLCQDILNHYFATCKITLFLLIFASI